MTRSRPSILLLACSASACLYSPDLPADATGESSAATAPTTSGAPAPTTGGDPSAATGGSTSAAMGDDSSSVTTATTVDVTTAPDDSPPDAPTLKLQFSQVKQFDFSWPAVAGADYYQLFERVDSDAEYVALGQDIFGTEVSKTMPLHLRVGSSYLLQACNDVECTPSEPLVVVDSLAAAIGYFKASNPGPADSFGFRVALSGDGGTMAVAATAEDGEDDSVESAGAVYIFVRGAKKDDTWAEQTVLRAPNPGTGDYFGFTLALSENGDTLAVGVPSDDSAATGIGGDQTDDTATDAGAVHVFTRQDGAWSPQAYLKASNADASDLFGCSIALSGAGNVLAVGAFYEDAPDDQVADSGAVYVFTRGESWSETAYLKPSISDKGDKFGSSVALSYAGDTLVVGAKGEASGTGDADDNTLVGAGAVYVYAEDDGKWIDEHYLKADLPGEYDDFGSRVALSGNGTTLVVGAIYENGLNDASADSGAAYVFEWMQGNWAPTAYLKASNSEASTLFGGSIALSAEGDVLVISAVQERGGAAGVDGDQTDTSLKSSGAVYVFERTGRGWVRPPRYVKAANPGKNDRFGTLALSADGQTLAVGAHGEDSSAAGIGGAQNDAVPDFNAGAVYVY